MSDRLNRFPSVSDFPKTCLHNPTCRTAPKVEKLQTAGGLRLRDISSPRCLSRFTQSVIADNESWGNNAQRACFRKNKIGVFFLNYWWRHMKTMRSTERENVTIFLDNASCSVVQICPFKLLSQLQVAPQQCWRWRNSWEQLLTNVLQAHRISHKETAPAKRENKTSRFDLEKVQHSSCLYFIDFYCTSLKQDTTRFPWLGQLVIWHILFAH